MRRFIGVGLFLLFVFCLTLLMRKPFLLESLQIQGNHFIKKEQIETHFAALKNKPLLFAFWMIATSDMSAPFPEIAEMRVQIRFPNRLVLSVEEYQPWTLFVSNTQQYLVAENGCILNKHNADATTDLLSQLIIIRGLNETAFQGQFVPNNVIKRVNKVVPLIQKYVPFSNLQIDFLSDGNIDLLKEDSLPIKLGDMADIEQKIFRLKVFLEHYHTQSTNRLEYIDLRMHDRLLVSFAE